MAIATLYLPHPAVDEKVEAVKAEMRKLGAPKIRVVDCKDYYMAIEGCHRLMAAADLGIAPCLTVLDREDIHAAAKRSIWNGLGQAASATRC